MKQLFLTLLGLSLLNSISVSADPGTLHDGRPFRTDAQGVEIADYVSELEQSVTYLKDRVRELEQQLDTSKTTIARLKEDGEIEEPRAIPEPKLFEKDLDIAPRQQTTSVVPGISKDDSFVIGTVEDVRDNVEPVKVAAVKPSLKTIVKPAPKALDPIEIIKGEARKNITEAKSLQAERDTLYKNYTASDIPKPISFTPARVQSKGKRSIIELENAIKMAKKERELIQIRSEIAQIKRMLSDDIALIKRLSKIK